MTVGVLTGAMPMASAAAPTELAGVGAIASSGPAQESPAPTSPTVSMPSIIPQPNSGAAPKTGTDRGGWVQWTVMGGMVVALGVIVLLVRRESRRKQSALRSSSPASPPSTSSI